RGRRGALRAAGLVRERQQLGPLRARRRRVRDAAGAARSPRLPPTRAGVGAIVSFFTSPTVTVTLREAGPYRVGQTVTFAVQFLNRTRTGTRRVELACPAFARTVFVDLTSDENASEVQARLAQPGQHRTSVAVLKNEDGSWQPSSILLDDSCP